MKKKEDISAYWDELLKEYIVYKTDDHKNKTEIRITPAKEYVIERLNERKTMQLYIDRLAAIENMTDEEAGQFIKSLYALQTKFEMPKLKTIGDRFIEKVYSDILPERITLDRSYIKKCMQNRLNNKSVSIDEFIRVATSGNEWQQAAAYTDTDKDIDKDTDIGKGKGKVRETETLTPLQKQIKEMYGY